MTEAEYATAIAFDDPGQLVRVYDYVASLNEPSDSPSQLLLDSVCWQGQTRLRRAIEGHAHFWEVFEWWQKWQGAGAWAELPSRSRTSRRGLCYGPLHIPPSFALVDTCPQLACQSYGVRVMRWVWCTRSTTSSLRTRREAIDGLQGCGKGLEYLCFARATNTVAREQGGEGSCGGVVLNNRVGDEDGDEEGARRWGWRSRGD